MSDSDILSTARMPEPRRNMLAIVLSIVAVLAVIIGGVAYVGYHKLASTGGQPDSWAPANSIAFIKVDLDPSASAKIAALRFERTFPNAPHVTSADQLKDALLAAAFNDQSGPSTINYADDVKPWLGSRIALAVYPDAKSVQQVVGIVQVTDAAKAKAGLAKIVEDSVGHAAGYAVMGEYAVVGPSQAAVDAAIAAAHTSNITSRGDYASDVATLKGDRILTAWADLAAMSKLAEKALAGRGSILLPGRFGALSGLAGLSARSGSSRWSSSTSLTTLGIGTTGATAKGRLVVGLQLQPGYAELEGRILGSDVSAYQNGTAGSLLGQLPAGAVGAVAVSGLGAVITKELATLEQSPLVAAGVNSQLDGIGNKLGIALPGDAVNLLGNEFAIGLDTVPSGSGSGRLTAITEPTDATKGLQTMQKLVALTSQSRFPFTASAHGSQIVITNDSGATGALSDDAGFKNAMSGMPTQVVGAAYVNLAAIWASGTASKVPADIQHLSGIGAYESVDGGDLVFAVRVTVN
jgi:Protein of unknown function (DUF3352)